MALRFDDSEGRRLPVYLLLDCSGSMSGSPIEQVNQGVSLLVGELRSNPRALETVWLSIITFDSEARQLMPLTELSQFNAPTLQAAGTTAMGKALQLLNDAVEREVVANSPDRKGDYKPLVFLMTDGEPTDTWEAAAQAVKKRTERKLANIIAVGCGDDVNTSTLKQITEIVLLMRDVTPQAMQAFFKWVSDSVQLASDKADAGAPDGAGAQLGAPPPGIEIVM